MMINKHKIIFTFTVISFLLLAGCASYNPRPLNRLMPVVSPHTEEQFLSFSYHVFTKDDCLKYLDRDVIAKGYQPIHIGIINHSAHSYYFSLSNFSFPCVPALDIAQKVHTSTTKRIAGYGILSLFLWPFLIPAVIDGVKSSEANQYLDMDFSKKALEDQSISAFSTANGLIFVPTESFNYQFYFTLIDHENHERVMLNPTKPRIKFKTHALAEYIKQK